MTSFSIQFHRGTCEVDVTEFPAERTEEEAHAVRVDAEIAGINGDLPVLC
jgi:hypothetical protein